ncbi:MAG: hypothetical protein GXP36_00300 [Actinobacteria bacterium]|nr:hypothetical protein [Actinomycetota bacterium]
MNPVAILLDLLAGISIGTVGVGGVILVLVLTYALGYDLQTAIATCSEDVPVLVELEWRPPVVHCGIML